MAGLRTGYPGLTYTAKQIAEFIGECDIFCEPFAGLGRISKHIKANKIILNDKSDFAINFLKENFQNATITNDDFIESILKNDSLKTTFLIDPPWSKVDYAKNPKTFCDRGVGDYYRQLRELLPNIKGKWFVAGRAMGGARSSVSVHFNGYQNIIIYSDKKINGYIAKTKLYFN